MKRDEILEYLSKKCDVKQKFNKAFKHLHLSAKEVMYVGIMNGEPEVWNVNSLRFNCDKSPDVDFIELETLTYRRMYRAIWALGPSNSPPPLPQLR